MRRLVWMLGGLACGLVLTVTGAHLVLRASLPALDGTGSLTGLSAPVTIERDALGVVTLTAADRIDLARATGFVHAQDRYFQMDLTRRAAAGELAALLGPAALPADRRHRVHRLRRVAEAVVAALTPEHRRLLEAYTEGVNGGLAALGARPPEYWLLGAPPEPWRPEDSVLVVHAMFLQLTDEGGRIDRQRGVLREGLPPALYALVEPDGGPWDAPLVGAAKPGPAVPEAAVAGLSRGPIPAIEPAGPVAGSNSWAVTDGRRAVVANDMHLGLGVPNVFYRARLVVPQGPGGSGMDVAGVMLPGLPAVVVGSNGRVAWSFTNSYGDWTDVVSLEIDPADPDRYAVPEGRARFERVEERLAVRGAEPETLVFRATRWGPVVETDGELQAVRWLPQLPQAVNLELLALERAGDLDAAIAIAQRAGVPPLNFVAADADGRIGWTIAGRMPRRAGYDPDFPASWAAPGTGWTGWLEPAEYPVVTDPEAGFIWTANSRVTDGIGLERLGDGGYALGARATQIRDRLAALGPAPDLQAMLALQLDDEARFLARWQALASELLEGRGARDPLAEEAAALIAGWSGRAAVDSAAYRIVRAFRAKVAEAVYAALVAGVETELTLRPPFDFEHGLWPVIERRPPHLRPPGWPDWQDFLNAMLDQALVELAATGEGRLALRTWGERNMARIRHPLSAALPGPIAGRLDMTAEPLPGDAWMPRVQAPAFGASERFAVSPGREQAGYLHMPAGQSGHPLSPFYRAGHDAWVEGRPEAFLPGPAVHRLKLAP